MDLQLARVTDFKTWSVEELEKLSDLKIVEMVTYLFRYFSTKKACLKGIKYKNN